MAKDTAKGFPTVAEFLKDKNIWVGNTGATTHVTRSKVGMTELRRGDSRIKMGNDMVKKTQEVGMLHGVICNNQGNTKE